MVEWWSQIIEGNKYPSLSKVVTAALSVFHGPQVESSFSYMTDVLDSKAGRMNIETFSSIQTVKYFLRSQKKSAVEVYERPDVKFSGVDKRLCRNIRCAAKRDKDERKKCQELKSQRMKEYGITSSKKTSAAKALRDKQAEIKAAREAHAAKQRKAARKRALESLAASARQAKKAKINHNQWM